MASKIQVDKISRNSGTPEFTIPTADGTNGQAIVTNGSGVLSFADAGPSLTGSTNTWIPTITGANAMAGTANFTYDGNTLDVKNSGTASSINLYCETGNAHYTKIKSGPHSGATSYTLTLPNKPPTVSGQALTATTAGAASWAAVGFNDYEALWRMTTNFTSSADPVVNWAAQPAQLFDPKSHGLMVEATGIWTFPTTGHWKVHIHSWHDDTGSNGDEWCDIYISISTDSGSSFTDSTYAQPGWNTDYSDYMGGTSDHYYIFDVTSTSTHKIKFKCQASQTNMRTRGSSTNNETYAIFTRLGDT